MPSVRRFILPRVTRETLLNRGVGPQHTTDTGYLRLLTEAGMGYRFAPES